MLADVNGDVQSEGSVMSIFDLLYREYCRARLAEMRKQVLTPVASDEILEAHGDGGDQPRRTKPQSSGSRDTYPHRSVGLLGAISFNLGRCAAAVAQRCA